MKETNNEKIEVDGVVVPNDDMGDLISVLFQAGFSDQEADIVLELVSELTQAPADSFMLDDEIMKLRDKFESMNIDLSEEDVSVIRGELQKRFK